MRRLTFIILSFICVVSLSAQITRQNELFKEVPIINNKVAFVKEVNTQGKSATEVYEILRDWTRSNYGNDPFISSVRCDAKKNEVIAKSRVELVLPANVYGVREKMVMRYRIDGFIFEDKCILQISDLFYLHENPHEKKLPRVIRAEDFITDQKIEESGALQELRTNARKSTLYFLNSLGKGFEEEFGY